MIRIATPRPLRTGVAAASVLGVIALAGCASDTPADAETSAPANTPEATMSTAAPDGDADSGATTDAAPVGDYTDGTYSAEGSYQTPESVETITVTVTLEDDIVTAVNVTGEPTKRESEQYQSQFIGGISDVVVGEDIDDLSVSRVAGSSLTSGGFNAAIDQIKQEAAA